MIYKSNHKWKITGIFLKMMIYTLNHTMQTTNAFLKLMNYTPYQKKQQRSYSWTWWSSHQIKWWRQETLYWTYQITPLQLQTISRTWWSSYISNRMRHQTYCSLWKKFPFFIWKDSKIAWLVQSFWQCKGGFANGCSKVSQHGLAYSKGT